jgi:hypothetical protein
MQLRRVVLSVVMLTLAAGIAAADTKVVKQTHRDAFTIMNKTQPAEDTENVTWIGDGRLCVEQKGSSYIVRNDLKKMYLVDHAAKQYSEVELPIDLKKLLPPEMAQQMSQMMQMMKLDAKVTPTEETKLVGPWKARRYDVAVTSAMMQMKMQVWASKDVKIDYSAFTSMYEQTKLLAPGMEAMVAEMRKIEGFPVASEGSMTMMNSEVKTSEKTVSVEEAAAPAGIYDPPAGYTLKPFDFIKAQQMAK